MASRLLAAAGMEVVDTAGGGGRIANSSVDAGGSTGVDSDADVADGEVQPLGGPGGGDAAGDVELTKERMGEPAANTRLRVVKA
eukprot:6189567-Pleurochrysis_carterae.AAC.1